MHVSADQSSGSIVFLHDVDDAPAYYGIAVAGCWHLRRAYPRSPKGNLLLEKLTPLLFSTGPVGIGGGCKDRVSRTYSTEPLSEPTVSDSELSLLNALRVTQTVFLPERHLKVLYELKDMLGTR